MTNTKLLEEKIAKSGLKKKYIAESLGLTGYGLQKKITNKTEFKASEIAKLCEVLNIESSEEKEEIFFAKVVD